MTTLASLYPTYKASNYKAMCDALGNSVSAFAHIIQRYGYPKLVTRKLNYSSLVHIILEQQVSLASALAAYNKLLLTLGSITPTTILQATDATLKQCYCSRQKITYIKALAHAILSKQLILSQLPYDADAVVIHKLTHIKGIGSWTASIVLLICLQRCNIFPIGDIALVQSMKHELGLPKHTTKEALITIATEWQPYHSMATLLLWHAYLCRKKPIQ